MKKKILTLGAVLALVAVLIAPSAVLAATTTGVTGNVIQGYTFSAPLAIALGDMTPGATATGSSTDGSLEGNDPAGYTVTGIDAKGSNTGYMVVDSNVLASKHQISNEDANYVNADTAKTFVDTSEATDVTVSLYVKQGVTYTDPVDTGYSITITFTVTPKT